MTLLCLICVYTYLVDMHVCTYLVDKLYICLVDMCVHLSGGHMYACIWLICVYTYLVDMCMHEFG